MLPAPPGAAMAVIGFTAHHMIAADVSREVLYAQVAPGNAASLRAFLRAGFEPIGCEVLFL